MSTLKQEIASIRQNAGKGCGLQELLNELRTALMTHASETAHINAAYAFETEDTYIHYHFALRGGVYSELADTDACDVTVSGTEANLLKLIRGELNPATAVLLRKVKVRGSMGTLAALAEFL